MYLTGKKYFMRRRARGDRKGELYDLGYWRKHPDLHGYIVREFAGGEDRCQEIWLDEDRIRQVIEAVKRRRLPETDGFFFGASEDTDGRIAHDVRVFEEALSWLEAEEPGEMRSITYQASW
jgi:hypothetical protein